MWYVYALRGKNKTYIGSTDNLKRRFAEHTRGQTYTTRRLGKLKLIYYEAFLEKKDALVQERFYKSGYGREVLKEKLTNTLEKFSAQSSEVV